MPFLATRKCLSVDGIHVRNSPVPTMHLASSLFQPCVLTLRFWLHRQKNGPLFLTNFLFQIQTNIGFLTIGTQDLQPWTVRLPPLLE